VRRGLADVHGKAKRTPRNGQSGACQFISHRTRDRKHVTQLLISSHLYWTVDTVQYISVQMNDVNARLDAARTGES